MCIFQLFLHTVGVFLLVKLHFLYLILFSDLNQILRLQWHLLLFLFEDFVCVHFSTFPSHCRHFFVVVFTSKLSA